MKKCKYCKNRTNCTLIKVLVWLLRWGLFFIAGDSSKRTYISRYVANVCLFYKRVK